MTSAAGRTRRGTWAAQREVGRAPGGTGARRDWREGRIGRQDGETRGNIKVGEGKELARGAGSRVTRNLISSQSERWGRKQSKERPDFFLSLIAVLSPAFATAACCCVYVVHSSCVSFASHALSYHQRRTCAPAISSGWGALGDRYVRLPFA